MLRIDPPQQLAFIEPKGQRVICLACARLPGGFLTRQHHGQAIEIGDDTPIDRLVDREQPGLVGQELTDGDRSLPCCANSGQ